MKTLVPLLTVLLLVAACSDGSDSMPLAPEASNLSFIGFGGTVDGVPPSATNVDNSFAFPSSNEENIGKEWANVTWNSADAGIGSAPLRFEAPRALNSCFEYRIDDEAPTDTRPNFNNTVTDGMWSFACLNNSTATRDLTANSHVDVRMAFGSERDERFDWTRFYVMTQISKDQCKDGGWQALGFKNQGQCIRFVETGKDSR